MMAGLGERWAPGHELGMCLRLLNMPGGAQSQGTCLAHSSLCRPGRCHLRTQAKFLLPNTTPSPEQEAATRALTSGQTVPRGQLLGKWPKGGSLLGKRDLLGEAVSCERAIRTELLPRHLCPDPATSIIQHDTTGVAGWITGVHLRAHGSLSTWGPA